MNPHAVKYFSKLLSVCRQASVAEIMCMIVLSLILTAAGSLFAQTKGPRSLAGFVLSETSALDAAPDLAAWRNLHPDERLKTAAYDNEYESQGLWCAASVAEVALPGGIKATRLAFFYVPTGKTEAALPARQDAGLVRQCRLLALWYEVHDPADPGGLAKSVSAELAASLGPAEETPPLKRLDDWGAGYWNPYFVWERANRRMLLAVDPGGPPQVPNPNARTRLLVIARASQVPRGISFDWMGEFPKGQPSFKEAAGRVAAQGSLGERKAAALILADITRKRLTEPGSGPGAWRSRAEQMDPTGAAGEIARVAHAESPCAFDDGRNNWQGGLIQFGTKLLRDFPASPWKSYVHLTMARAYAAKLLLTYPDIDLNGANRPNDPEALRRNAIAHFRAFLEETRDSPESAIAWREAWRLLAGLPPSLTHFACTD
jgi:hypothetical protein